MANYNGSQGSESIAGSSANDVIYGYAGNDLIFGGAGADVMYGGSGDDTYYVESAKDKVVENANEGVDTVIASISYTLGVNIENLTLSGTANLNATGNALNNTLIGTSGNNAINGGTGADRMVGGIGNDTYYVDNAGDLIEEYYTQGIDTVISTVSYSLSAHVENLTLMGTALVGTGNDRDNVILGNAAGNTLSGAEGYDTLNGGAGADTMSGGVGNDTYYVDNAGDKVIESSGEGIDTVLSSITYSLGVDVENLTLTGTGAINATGNDLNNTIVGNAGANIIDGGTGADMMSGGAGNDTYYIDNSSDVVIENANAGTDTVISIFDYTLGNNIENITLVGTSDIDAVGNSFNNYLKGNAGKNVLNSGAGNDTIDGGAGVDTMIGGLGSDVYYVDDSSDQITELGEDGTDAVYSSASYVLSSNVENIVLLGSGNLNATGNSLNNTMLGNSGINILDSGAGDDVLNGGLGADTMIGGAGNDTYYVDNIGDVITEGTIIGADSIVSIINYTIASNVETLALSGAAIIATGNNQDNTLIGTAAVNTLYGLGGNDTLNGAAGADSMYGGVGNDTYFVDNAGDKIFENSGEGLDTVVSAASYTLGVDIENVVLSGTAATKAVGNGANNSIVGNSGSNTLDGGAGDDDIVGGAGNDIIIGGLGSDIMYGGIGNDTYYVDDSTDTVIEAFNSGIDLVITSVSYTSSANIENITLTGADDINATGNELNNSIVGNAGNNILDGGSGSDILNGGAGADAMIGGSGDDTYYVDNSGDTIIESTNEGADTVYSTAANYTLGDNVEKLILSGTAAINGTGSAENNTITGNASSNVIDGGAGADVMVGGKGNDTYYVDNAADVVTEAASSGTDSILSSVSYTISANVESLTLIGSADINATGNAVANILTGNSGDNVLNGMAGADTMRGLGGDDTYYVDNIGDLVYENAGQGIDTVISSLSYTILDGVENLTLSGNTAIDGTGNNGDNYILGNSAVNTLRGGAGNDTIDGGLGNDSLYGGTGNDTYYVNTVNDSVFENYNEGVDTLIATCSYTLGANMDNLTLVGAMSVNTATVNGVNVNTFGESALWKNYLDYYQGDNTSGYLGVCGLVSSENVLIQAGVFNKKVGYTPGGSYIDQLESTVVTLAKTHGWCITSGNPSQQGGTYAQWQEAILEYYGVQATSTSMSLEGLAQAVKDNKGVILHIDAYSIWNNRVGTQVNHAITLTGVAYNANDPTKIEGFYVCDSGRRMSSDSERFLTYNQLKSAFYVYSSTSGTVVITDGAVKEQLASMDGTGNELNNVMTGSDGNNVLSGLAGNDTYVINAHGGYDTIVDSSGSNDLLSFGSGIFKSDFAIFKSNNDLILDYNNGNQVTIQDQLSGSDAIEKIQLSDNSFMTSAGINTLIQQMSSYASSHGMGQLTASAVRNDTYLNNLVASSWQAA